jgi:hypothetical protein
MGELEVSGSFAALRMTARTDNGNSKGKSNSNGKQQQQRHYNGRRDDSNFGR